MGSASPHCEERHTSCELLLDIREGPGRRTGFAFSSHSGQATATLASVLAAPVGIPFNGHDGTLMTTRPCSTTPASLASRASCRSKDSLYHPGRSPDWLTMKNPACEAVRREAVEDSGNEAWSRTVAF